jgi:UDP-3-O-[3-hydroxymyristoyl] glucosamine N-acyltransferase
VGPLAVIEDEAHIGERVFVGPGCVVQRGARIGADTRLTARVTVCAGVSIGLRCVLHPGAVVGADGFGFALDGGAWVKVPQVGSVQIGDDVEIGANTTIDRGAIDDTVVEHGVKLDNQIQVGHNVTIGAHTAIAGCVGISGSTTIGRRCMIGGGVGIAGHLTIADDVVVTGCSLVSASIKSAGSYSSGMPAVETRMWRRMVAHLRRLDTKER